jgi:5-(carboxyamino)imidazole ribonucleotide mutase
MARNRSFLKNLNCVGEVRAMVEVAIFMGSDSDKEIMLGAKTVLDMLEIECKMFITSAHRTPERTRSLVHELEKSGCRVFICGAGMAAHLAGAVAAETIRPVIGVPLTSPASPLGGVDALLSTVQMPSGMPVATVAIDGAKNAAWLAAEILAIGNPALAGVVFAAREIAAVKILGADGKLQTELAPSK